MKPLIIAIGIFLILGSSAFAVSDSTTTESPRLSWVTLGLGPGSCSAWSAVSGMISYSTTAKGSGKILTFRYGRADEWDGDILDWGDPRPFESVWDLGVLYGAISKGGSGFVSASAGLAVVGGVKRGAFLRYEGEWFGHDVYEARHFTTVGIPIEAQAFWTPPHSFGLSTGLGLELYANLNPVRSYVGANLCIQFGKVR
jgi:hypothetical protein